MRRPVVAACLGACTQRQPAAAPMAAAAGVGVTHAQVKPAAQAGLHPAAAGLAAAVDGLARGGGGGGFFAPAASGFGLPIAVAAWGCCRGSGGGGGLRRSKLPVPVGSGTHPAQPSAPNPHLKPARQSKASGPPLQLRW